jgi:hypothetical protein
MRQGEMAERWVPIWETVGTAYALALRSVLRFPLTTLAVSAVVFIINSYTVPLSLSSIAAAQPLLVLLNEVLRAIVLAPLAILIHRSIILGEWTGTYLMMGTHRRARQFVGVALLLALVQELANFVGSLDRYSGWFILPTFVILIASIVLSIRLCLAFPAIATDQSAAPIRDSFRYVKGSGLAIFFMFFCAALCWMPIEIPLLFADRLSLFAENPGLLLALRAVQQLSATFMVVVYVSAASQLWRTRALWSEAVAPTPTAAA